MTRRLQYSVASHVKMRALGAMGAAATLPGDRITDSTLPPSLVVLKKVGSPNLRSERPGERATEY